MQCDIISVLHRLTHFIPTTTLGLRCYYCYYFTEGVNKPRKAGQLVQDHASNK